MGYSRQVIEKVKEELEQKRKNAEATAETHREEMYAKAPLLRDIETALSATGLKIYAAALEGKEGLEERISALKKENQSLLDDRARILSACGKPADYLSVHYSCPHCKDSGYNGLKMCDCMRKALIRQAYESSGLGAVLTEQSFDNFDLGFYSDIKDKNGYSPRDYMTNIYEAAKDYATQFGKAGEMQTKNLLFAGKTGLGKTHISTAIAKCVIDKGYDVVYDTVQNVLHTYELQTFAHNEQAAQTTERYAECALLILDDLGTEFKTGFTSSTLYNLINLRLMSGSPMIINTNLDSTEQLRKQYDDRILSRLIGNFRTFLFVGEDIRLKRRNI